MFYKDPSPFEVYNDYNVNLFCLFNAVKNQPLALINELGFFPLNSRDEFNVLLDFMKKKEFDRTYMEKEMSLAEKILKPLEFKEIENFYAEELDKYDVKRAAAFYKLIRYSYGAGGKSPACQPINIRNMFYQMKQASIRLEEVIIENKDFEGLIRQYERDEAFFYCDPPYYETEKHYEVGFPKENHERLRDVLKTVKGNFLLSYNDCEYIRELYKNFHIEAISRPNTLALRYNPKAEFKELFISNYDTSERGKIVPPQMSLFDM